MTMAGAPTKTEKKTNAMAFVMTLNIDVNTLGDQVKAVRLTITASIQIVKIK